MGLGIMPRGPTENLFKEIDNKFDDFASKTFHKDMSPLEVSTERFRVKGQMGNNHTPTMQIQFYRNNEEVFLNVDDRYEI